MSELRVNGNLQFGKFTVRCRFDYSFRIKGESDKTPSPQTTNAELRFVWCIATRLRSGIPRFPKKIIKVWDFSETGAFLLCEWTEMPPLGSMIEIQV
ncbi:MAG: hypothetical protein ACRERU_20605 [Methylococcales bacterium]